MAVIDNGYLRGQIGNVGITGQRENREGPHAGQRWNVYLFTQQRNIKSGGNNCSFYAEQPFQIKLKLQNRAIAMIALYLFNVQHELYRFRLILQPRCLLTA
ncbi:hypothetical protein [Sphingobacterium arenae]|uniref:hypothetical protein n=1 Tax=Sphingobacterium arenae TaxID=1280598 RepID=UPI00167FFC43